jgi:endoglucanase
MAFKAKALIAAGAGAAVLVTAGVAVIAVGLPGSKHSDSAAPGVSASSTPTTNSSAPTTRTATAIGRAFLADYVQKTGAEKGRVIRRDQGGDTVSEARATASSSPPRPATRSRSARSGRGRRRTSSGRTG